jgi:hypothetical protein
MKKILSVILLILFLNNTIKGNEEYLKINGDIIKINDFGVIELYQHNTIFSIEFICQYIFKNLDIKWDYSNIDDLLIDLNITEGYTIKESIIDNPYHTRESFFYVYNIEYNQYKINIWNLENLPNKYWLMSIEIELNENNYLNLFPYRNKDDYLNDNSF